VDLYDNACQTERAAINLLSTGDYRHSVFTSCLTTELYLKSKLHLVEVVLLILI